MHVMNEHWHTLGFQSFSLDLNLIAPWSRMSASSKCQYCLCSKRGWTNAKQIHLKEPEGERMRPCSTLLQLDDPLHRLVRLLPSKVEQFHWNYFFKLFFLLFKLTFNHLPPLLLRRLVQNTSQVLAEGSACPQLGASALHHLLGGCLDEKEGHLWSEFLGHLHLFKLALEQTKLELLRAKPGIGVIVVQPFKKKSLHFNV